MLTASVLRAAAMVTLLATGAAAQPSFQALGDLPGAAFESSADGVSADGTVVVGYGTMASGTQAFRWTTVGGMVAIGGSSESAAFGVSADGSVVTGFTSSIDGLQAFRWTSAGLVLLGDLAGAPFGSIAGAVTLDGKTIVGIGNLDSGAGTGEAYRWTSALGMQGLGDLAGGIFSSTATAITSDATIIVGTGNFQAGIQGQAFRRLANGTMVSLGDLPGGALHSNADFVSFDGAVVVGFGTTAQGLNAFRWTGAGMIGLGDFAGGAVDSEALACNGDGTVLVGVGHDAAGEKAFYWTQAGGMVGLQDLLLSKGVTGLTGWKLRSANACSADGNVIVGYGTNPGGKQEAWMARLSNACNTDTTRASIGSPGDVQANGGSASGSATQNGQLVAFESGASNLAYNDSNGKTDIFVRNRPSNWTTRVSLTNAGFQANGDSWAARISAQNGRYVAFVSKASNLVPGDSNGRSDIFVRDRVNNTTTRVSIATTGTQANGHSDQPQISADGRYIVFQSAATNLITFDGNGRTDIFLRDTANGTTERVSISSTEVQANGHCSSPTVSNDGRFIAFLSDSNNLFFPDNNLARDVFVRDRTLGLTSRASLSSSGAQANGPSTLSRMSSNGRFVAFTSTATNLVGADTNAKGDVFVRDRVNLSTIRVSLGPAQLQANQVCDAVAISSTGRFILFNSIATNLVPHDTNNVRDAFLHDRWTMKTTRVGVGDDDEQATAGANGTSLSGDGRTVIFHSGAGNLVPGDTGFSDVFVREVCKP